MAARIAQYLAAESDENGRGVYMTIYHSLHGNRYRDRHGQDLWAEALTYLGRAVRHENGFIWLDQEARLISVLPPPYKPAPKFKMLQSPR